MTTPHPEQPAEGPVDVPDDDGADETTESTESNQSSESNEPRG